MSFVSLVVLFVVVINCLGFEEMWRSSMYFLCMSELNVYDVECHCD